MMPWRRTAFRGRFRRAGPSVAGNLPRARVTKAYRDFPLYVGRQLTLRQEQKYIDTSIGIGVGADYSYFAASLAPALFMPNMPARGDALNARLGDRVLINNILVRGRFIAPTIINSGATSVTTMDLFLVHDRQPTGNYPALSTLFTVASLALGYGLLQDPSTRDRFSLLYRYRYTMTGTAKTGAGAALQQDGDRVSIPIDWNLSVNKVTVFNTASSAAAIAQVMKGALYFIFASNQPITGSPPSTNQSPYFQGNIRTLFADL